MKNFFPAIVAFGLSCGISTYSSYTSNSQNIKGNNQKTDTKHSKENKGSALRKDTISKILKAEDKQTHV